MAENSRLAHSGGVERTRHSESSAVTRSSDDTPAHFEVRICGCGGRACCFHCRDLVPCAREKSTPTEAPRRRGAGSCGGSWSMSLRRVCARRMVVVGLAVRTCPSRIDAIAIARCSAVEHTHPASPVVSPCPAVPSLRRHRLPLIRRAARSTLRTRLAARRAWE